MPHAYEAFGLLLASPFPLEGESATLRLRAAPSDGAPRPNLVVHRRRVPRGSTLSGCIEAIAAELEAGIEGVSAIGREPVRFADGQTGEALRYTLPSPAGGGSVAQLQAVRLDGSTLSTLTLTDLSPSGLDLEVVSRAGLSVGRTASPADPASRGGA